MTDERIDALIRRLDIPSKPDPAFVAATTELLRPRVRAARVQDTSRLGRARRDLGLLFRPARRSSVPRPIAVVGVAGLLLLLAVAAMIVIAGMLNRPPPIGNGPLILAVGGGVRALDVDTGSSRPIVPASEGAKHVSRSPDGRLIAYWKVDPVGEELTFSTIDGNGRLRVSEEQGHKVTWGGCIDTWSSDSRYLATEVTVDGSNRILVADSATGKGRLVTPEGVVAHCPLWSPDGRSIAFAQEMRSGPGILAIIRTDGTGMHGVSGDIGGGDVAGANTWSPDGVWIYFVTGGAGGTNWRANVVTRTSTRLTHGVRFETAVASSPDDTLISWIMSVPTSVGWDVYVANSDGTNPRLLLRDALSLGWSTDGRYVLTLWKPSDRSGGITLAPPDGSKPRVLIPADQSCIDADRICDIGWGQARP